MSKTLQLKVITALQDKLSGPLKNIRGASGQSAQSMKELRDKLKGLESTQKTVNQFRELSRGVDQSRESMQQAQARANELGQKLQGIERPTAAMRREFTQATNASRQLKQEHQQQSQKLQSVRDKLHNAGISTKSLSADERQLRERISSTNQALEQQGQRLSKVYQEQRKLAQAKEKYEATTAVASNLAVTGAAGYASGRRVLGGMSNLMADGMDFDKTMSKVQALARLDKDSIEMQQLRDQARHLGATTAFTTSDAASGQAFLAMAGFTPDAITAAMPGILDMALAGDMDLASTADISSNILSGFGLEAEEMGRIADVLTGAFTRSNTSISSLGDTMKFAAPIAAQFGVDVETTAAMAAKLGDAGIQGGEAGTNIRRIINRLAAPNKAASDALEKLNVQVADATGAMRPMDDLLAEIHEKSKNLSEIERGEIFKAIGGEQGVGALGILVDSAGTGQLQELQGELRNAAGEAAKVAKVQADNALGDLNVLKSAWSDISIEIFSQNNDAIREVIQTISAAVSAVGEWARRNPELVSTIIKVVAVVAALMVGLGGIAITIAGILGPFAMMRYSMTMLGIRGGGLISTFTSLGRNILPMVGNAIMFVGRALLMNPIGLAVTAIAAAAFLIYKYWEPIKEFFSGLWDEVKLAFDGGIAGVGALILNWSPLGLFYQVFASVMEYFGVELPAKFSEFGSMMMTGLVNGIKGMATSVKDSVVGVAKSTGNWFKSTLGIESPSKVFLGLGSEVSAGAALGIASKAPMAEKAAAALASVVMAGGAMMPLSASAFSDLPALKFDNRQSISSAQAASSAGNRPVVYEGDRIEIHIHASPDMNPSNIAQAISAELDKRERQKQARARSSLSDYGN